MDLLSVDKQYCRHGFATGERRLTLQDILHPHTFHLTLIFRHFEHAGSLTPPIHERAIKHVSLRVNVLPAPMLHAALEPSLVLARVRVRKLHQTFITVQLAIPETSTVQNLLRSEILPDTVGLIIAPLTLV